MNRNGYWLRFIETGSVGDYIKYRNCSNSTAEDLPDETEYDIDNGDYPQGAENQRE